MMNNEKIDKIIPTDELDNVLPKYEPVKLSGKNLAQQYVSAFNTGMNIYQCVNYLQGSIDATINGVNNVVKSWNDSVDETLTKSIEITKETTTEQFNKEWTDKQPELIEQVKTLTTNQFNEDWGVLDNRINTTLETQNTKINSIQTHQTNLANEQTTLSNRMDTFTRLSEGSTTGDAELKDIRVGANGITYDTAGNAVRGQYSQLKEDLGNLEKGIGSYEYISPNMFNKDTITLNKTINENGDIVDDPNNRYCTSDYVDVSGHTSIVFGYYNVGKWNTLNTYIVAFDSGKNLIGNRGLTGTLYSVPTNAKYIIVAFNPAYIDYAMIVDGGFQVDKYYPYYDYIDYLKGIKELINGAIPNVYYVGKSRTDKSFSAVVTEAVNHKNSIVYVDDGEYNIEEEFKAIYGDNFFNNFERSGRRGLYLGNGIKIIMSPNTTIKFHYSGNNANVKEMFSPFNFAPYSPYSSKDYEVNGFELRGGIIDVKNARYCSHDDPSSFNKPYTNTYRNVQMKLDNTENTVWGAHNCIGAGLGMYGELNIESCVFETVGSKDTTSSISIHNTSQPNSKSFISIRDNYLCGNNTIRLLYYGSSELKTKAIVCGNSVSRQIELKPNTSDSTIENIELIAWNNEIRSN